MATNTHMRSSDLPISHEGFLEHKRFRYLKLALLVVVISIVVFFLADVGAKHNGGTWLGYTLGTIGAGLIVFGKKGG